MKSRAILPAVAFVGLATSIYEPLIRCGVPVIAFHTTRQRLPWMRLKLSNAAECGAVRTSGGGVRNTCPDTTLANASKPPASANRMGEYVYLGSDGKRDFPTLRCAYDLQSAPC